MTDNMSATSGTQRPLQRVTSVNKGFGFSFWNIALLILNCVLNRNFQMTIVVDGTRQSKFLNYAFERNLVEYQVRVITCNKMY
jgi:hypothetical protein